MRPSTRRPRRSRRRARREELAPAQQPLLDLAELLLAVDRELLDLGLDLVGQFAEVGQALLVVDVDDDRGREVEEILELLGSDVEQVAERLGRSRS